MATTLPAQAKSLQIGRAAYQVSAQVSPRDGLPEYHLHGKRGAHYRTMRNAKNPALMFIVDCRDFGMAEPLRGVWLRDDGGELRRAS